MAPSIDEVPRRRISGKYIVLIVFALVALLGWFIYWTVTA